MGHADIRTTLEVYCDVFSNYEKQHANRTYDYLKDNNLLLTESYADAFPQQDLDKIIHNLKEMYKKQDEKLIKILKMVA